MMTIALGPEHHDIKLIDSQNRSNIGRLKCNITCNHIAPIYVSIDSISCKILEKTNNKISYKLSFKDVEHLVESDYSEVNVGKTSKTEEATLYKWFKENNTDKVDLIEIHNVNSIKLYSYIFII